MKVEKREGVDGSGNNNFGEESCGQDSNWKQQVSNLPS